MMIMAMPIGDGDKRLATGLVAMMRMMVFYDTDDG